jgi:hypothetical protein
MTPPAFLQLGVVTCLAMEVTTGSDDIIGVLEADRFQIGKFSAGDSVDVTIDRPIAPGATPGVLPPDNNPTLV